MVDGYPVDVGDGQDWGYMADGGGTHLILLK